MSLSLTIAIIASFFATLAIMPKMILFLQKIRMVGIDIQKKNRPKIAEMGGPSIVFGFLSGIFLYIWIKVFLYGGIEDIGTMFAGIMTIMIITLVGVFDDLSILMRSRKGFKRIGLKQWQKPLLTLVAAVPLMAIMAGSSAMSIPLVGIVDFGIWFPLILIPLAIVGASNATNMLAGMNGLEAGLGVVILSSLGIYSYFLGAITAAVIAFTLVAALLAFLKFNWYPAKIMPGDSSTYLIGSAVATVAIIGNIEKFAILAFLPWFIEFILKARSGMKAENFGSIQKDGTLRAPSKKNYSLTHVVMHLGKFKESQIVSILILAEAVLCAFLLWYYLIF